MRRRIRIAESGEAAEGALQDEHHGGEKEEKGDQAREDLFAGDRQQNGAHQPANDTDWDEAGQPRTHRGQLPAVAVHAAQSAENQREGVGGIGDQ